MRIDEIKKLISIHEAEQKIQQELQEFNMEKQQNQCAYCHEDADGYVKPLEKNGHAFISFGMLGAHISVNAKGWKNDITINYCPICGRQLLGRTIRQMV